MIKNRTAQLIFQSFFCAIGLIGIFASIGIFDDVKNLANNFSKLVRLLFTINKRRKEAENV